MRLAAGRDFATHGEVHLLNDAGRSIARGHLEVPDLHEPKRGDRLGLQFIVERAEGQPSMIPDGEE